MAAPQKPKAPADLESVRATHCNLFLDEACSINELAAISSALRSLPLLLLITKPDSDKVWLASRLLASSLRCPLAAIEGQTVQDLAGFIDESLAGLTSALKSPTPTEVSVCMRKPDGEAVCHTLKVMCLLTAFGKIGVAIGGDFAAE